MAYRVFLKSVVRGGFCFCDESNGDFRYVTNNDRLHQICGTSDLNLFIKLQQRNYALLIKMVEEVDPCLLYTSPSPRDATLSRMPTSP